MKLLLVCNYDGAIRYISQLASNLSAQGIFIDILDIGKYRFFRDCHSEKVILTQIVPQRILSIPFLRRIFRKYLTRRFIRKNYSYDVINLHYSTKTHYVYLNEFRSKSNKIVLTMWGSDFYRDKRKKKTEKIQIKLYEEVDKIMFANNYFKKEFLQYYKEKTFKDFSYKTTVVRWGLESIDVIKSILIENTKSELKNEFGIDNKSLVVTVGYNASVYQQHEYIIEKLIYVSKNTNNNLFILLPMTYSEDQPSYIEKIKTMMINSKLPFLLFPSLLSDIHVAKLRIVTDIAVNMQITDDLSGSIQEHLYAGNVVIAGSWLPYKVYHEYGINILLIKKEDLSSTLLKVVNNLHYYQAQLTTNIDKVYQFSSWKSNISSWIKTYNK